MMFFLYNKNKFPKSKLIEEIKLLICVKKAEIKFLTPFSSNYNSKTLNFNGYIHLEFYNIN